MVAEWMIALAQAGGAALLGAAATDTWGAARDGFTHLFRRGGAARAELVGEALDEDAAEVTGVDPAVRDEVRQRLLPAWQTRLLDLLREHPEAAEELRAWTARVESGLPAGRSTWVQRITASAPGSVAQGAMFGNVINHPGGLPPAGPTSPGAGGRNPTG